MAKVTGRPGAGPGRVFVPRGRLRQVVVAVRWGRGWPPSAVCAVVQLLDVDVRQLAGAVAFVAAYDPAGGPVVVVAGG